MRITDISISKRLWFAVLLPLIAMTYLAWLQVSGLWSSYNRMNEITIVSDNIATVGEIVHTLQVERGLSAGFLGSGGRNGAADLAVARQATDTAVARFPGFSAAIVILGDQTLNTQITTLGDELQDVKSYRQSIDTLSFTGRQSFDAYTGLIGHLTAVASELSMKGVGSQIAAEVIAYNQLIQAKEIAGQERASGNIFLNAGRVEPAQVSDFALMAGAQKAMLQTFLALQDQSLRMSYASALDIPALREIEQVRGRVVNGGAGDGLAGLDPKAWFSATTQRIDAMKGLENRSLERLGNLADGAASQALAGLIAVAVLCVTGGIVMIALSGFMAMTIVRPLKALVGAMSKLAGGNLEASEIGASRKDEVGDMARAVEVFRQAAIRNKQLEDEATAAREQAEKDRIAVQQRAEAEAEERLGRATGTLAAGLRKLASGDLVCEIDERFAPQFEALRHDFNSSVKQLRQTLMGVGQSVSTVNSGASEVSAASDDLSRRTEQQAASLEETAAALEQITSNVVATSRRSDEARGVTRNAHVQAGRSGEVVREAVVAMERIDHASRQIGQIIGVIDEIAFQTNLLALNAGVEAARAGDAGKGFAVVAQEVRELAQRSANAAREIKGLITNSEAAVCEGVRLVSDTGKGLADIVELVQQVNAHMDAIAVAAQEQAAGLSEINTAINHMDQATQQNAAMVEEMNAAGAGLAQESNTLERLLAGFQLTDAQNSGSAYAEPWRRQA